MKHTLRGLYHKTLYIIVINSKSLIPSVCIPVDMYFTPAIRCWKDLKMALESA